MSSNSINVPFPIFQDVDGDPLDAGYIYIGTANLDPETNPISIYFDKELTVPAPQPIRTLNGFPSNSGTPARLYTSANNYSLKVKNKNSTLVYNSNVDTEAISSSVISFNQDVTGSVATTVDAKLKEKISVKDFGAVGDGTTDDQAAIQAAIDYLTANDGGTLFFPRGDYYIASTITLTGSNLLISFEGEERYCSYITAANNITAIDDNVGILVNKLWIRSVQYRTDTTADSSGIGFKTSGRPTFDNVYIFGFGDCGIEASTPDKFLNACFRNLRIQTCGTGINIEGTGVGSDFTTTSCIENTYIASCTNGIAFINATACYVNNVIIEYCTTGALINGCVNFTVYNWYLEQNTTPYSATNSSLTIINETLANNTNPASVQFSEAVLGAIPFPSTTANPNELSSGKLGIKGVTGASTSRTEDITYLEHQNIGTPRAIKHTGRTTASGAISETGIIPQINGGTSIATKGHNIFSINVKGSTGASFNPATDVLSDDKNVTVSRPAAGVFEIVFNTGVIIDSLVVTPIQQYVSYPPTKMLVATPSFFNDTPPHDNYTKVSTANGYVTKIRVLIYDLLGTAFSDENFSVTIFGRLSDE